LLFDAYGYRSNGTNMCRLTLCEME